MTKQKLKIGLLVDDYSIPAWKYKVVEKIITSKYSQICLTINIVSKNRKSTKNSYWAYNLYQKFENQFFKPSPNAFAKKDLKNIVDCDSITLDPNKSKLYLDNINLIKNLEIDVIIKLNDGIISDEILKIPRFGVWSYYHGDINKNRFGPIGVWEVLNNEEETASNLLILKDNIDEKPIVIYESFSHTDHISFNRNSNNSLWKASSFVTRKLDELNRLGEEAFFQKHNKQLLEAGYNYSQTPTFPSLSKMFVGLVRNYYKSIKIHIRNYIYFDQWTLLIKLNASNKLPKSFGEFKRLTSPKDRFWADPFILEKNNKYFIFIEELIYKENRGTLAVMEMNKEGEYTNPKTILKKEYHLSYPFLIEDNNELFMIPETKGNRTIDIYKCTDFPYEWKFEKNIFSDIQAVDSTIYKYNGKFWLFTNIKENDGASAYDELFLFHSEDLLGDNWTPHPMNPIVSDVKCARPAGNIFELEGRTFRPSQNCAKHYGYGMQIREIVTLNEFEYEEKQIQSIYPDWDKDLVSTHTLNHSGGLTIIDALVRRRK